MEIHVLTTGTAEVKESFLHAASGLRRQLNLFLPGPFAAPLPIHCFVVEHDGRRLLIDTGEVHTAPDIAFVRFHVAPEDELPHQLQKLGLTTADIDQVVLTHLHGDHMDGAVHLDCPILAHDEEIAYANTFLVKVVFGKALKQGLPEGVTFEPYALDDGPFGAFARSKKLTDDGRIVAVATPGHTPGHVGIVCIDDAERHILFAGDATDTLEQLKDRRHDAVGPKPKVNVATIDTILEHARRHPTVFVPSHDPESAQRLADRTLLA